MKITTPNQALKRLISGNNRYILEKRLYPNQHRAYRSSLAKAQKPFACIFTCSDSRVVPEMIFDQGVGDLFIIRNAGHVLNDDVFATLEYAIMELKVKLVMVIGHLHCGAITAAIKNSENKGKYISQVSKKIAPAVEAARKQEGDLLINATKKHVENVVKEIKLTFSILMTQGEDMPMATGTYYNLESGTVTFLNSAHQRYRRSIQQSIISMPIVDKGGFPC